MAGETKKIWYVFDKGIIHGPLETDSVRKLSKEGINPASMVFQKGQTTWQKLSHWLEANSGWNDIWYVNSEGLSFGPFFLDELSHKVKSKQIPLNAKLWTGGLKKWVGIYDIPDLVKIVGFEARKHPRAPFVGDVKIQGLFQNRDVSTLSLSEGGLSLNHMHKLGAGAKLSLKITSELLAKPVSAKAVVVYETEKEAGLQFTKISKEDRKVLHDYVDQFEIPTFCAIPVDSTGS